MCLAVPSLVISIDDLIATIDVYGARRQVSLMLLPDPPRIGDYVLVHAGFAIQKIEKERVESGEIMHEASIALSILDIVQSKCHEEGCNSVDSIRVRIGKAAGILPDSLIFAFDSAKDNTVAKNATLAIETVPVGGTCHDCKKEFTVEDVQYVFSCPLCGSKSFDITSGREMEIVDMEIN
ncbi:MAG TPA: hydrogenase maturation nickel metallochaperone HypA [Nitrospirota bacterium]|nr:hydrogenase maturation nickel metallochaperone HypA [Nitrospirota bacterium]